jgi:HD-like signal output (HDOD) protein
MTELHHKATEQWLDKIVQQELPAITSTVKMLDKFVDDDVSSLSKLSEAILHDQALSSCILKVANSIPHFGVTKITTVSRATVMLGIHTVKNICLTSKLIDSLLTSKSLSKELYRHLSKTMATSFHAGILAKMMVPNYNEDTQEQMYLAAMLYRIGETAFWSSGDDAAEQLLIHKNLSVDAFEQQCEQLIGTNFTELSKGLANAWNLGDLLVKALDQPERRTREVQIVYFSDKLAQLIQQPSCSAEMFNELLEQISQLIKVDVTILRAQIEQTRIQAISLLNSYGAKKLTRYINNLPSAGEFIEQGSRPLTAQLEAQKQEKSLLSAVMQLTHLSKNSKDFNEFLVLTLSSIASHIGFDRCCFLMLSANKKQLKSRFAVDKQGHNEQLNIRLNISDSDNVFAHVIDKHISSLVNDAQSRQWRNYITKDITIFMQQGKLCISPVKINDSCIGVITGQLFDKSININTEKFNQFCFLVEHLSMCLTVISRH